MSCFAVCLMTLGSFSPVVYAACTDPITQEEEVYEDEDGNLYALSKRVHETSCSGCGDCVVPY